MPVDAADPWEPPAEFPGRVDLRRVHVRDGHELDAAVVADHVDRAPVGQPWHRDVGEPPKRLADDEGGGQDAARLREERQAPAGQFEAGQGRALALARRRLGQALPVHVGDGSDPLDDDAPVVADRRGPCDHVVVLVGRRVPDPAFRFEDRARVS
jgi:hypothetical protein